MKYFRVQNSRSYFLFAALFLGTASSRADDFEKALHKAQLLGAASAKFNANQALIIADHDPVAAAEYVAKIREFIKEFEKPEVFESQNAQNEAYANSIGVRDPDFVLRVTGTVVHKDEERFWTFIQSISKEMLKRLPRFKSSRLEVQNTFIHRILFEMKFKFAHYLETFEATALNSDRAEVKEFGHLLKRLKSKVDRGEVIDTAEIESVIATTDHLFSRYPVVYEDVTSYVELLEIYNSFQKLKTSKTPKFNKGSLVEELRKHTAFSSANIAQIKANIYRDAEYLNKLELNRLTPNLILLLSAQQNATVSESVPALVTATFNTIMGYFEMMGKAKLAEIQTEFMRGIPAGEFISAPTPSKTKKKPRTQKVKNQVKKSTKKEEQTETSDAPTPISLKTSSVQAPSEKQEPRANPELATEEVKIEVEVPLELKATSTVFDLPREMLGELNDKGDFISEADLDDYLKFQSAYPKRKPMAVQATEKKDALQEAPPLKIIQLSGRGAHVFQIASGQAFNEYQVSNRDFLDLLRQLRGGLVRSTGKGKGSARQYALPNLKDRNGKRPHNFYHLHFAHGGRDFNPKTLRAILGRDLEDAGYINNPQVEIQIE